MIQGCTHSYKVLFSSKDLELDLRYLTYKSDSCSKVPHIDLKIVDQTSERGLLGPSCAADFELEEGQIIVFVFRQVDGWQYKSKEHESVGNPDAEKLEKVGVEVQSMLEAASMLRPPENPLLSDVSEPATTLLCRCLSLSRHVPFHHQVDLCRC